MVPDHPNVWTDGSLVLDQVTDEVAARMPDAPKVWSDGSLVLDSVTGVSAAGAGGLLTSLSIAGVAVGVVMLIVFCWIMCLILAGDFFVCSWTFPVCSTC